MQAFTNLAARVRTVLTLFFALGLIALATERLGYAGLYRSEASGAALATQALLALPAILQLVSLWQLRRMAAEAARGAPFAAAAARGLRRAGLLLVIAAATMLFTAPALHRLLGQAYPRLIEFDVTTLITGAIGAALALVARLLDHGRAVESELEQIF